MNRFLKLPSVVKNVYNIFFYSFDELIGRKNYVAGESFSISDIDLLVLIDFAAWKKFKIPENAKNAWRWYENVSNRPSAKI